MCKCNNTKTGLMRRLCLVALSALLLTVSCQEPEDTTLAVVGKASLSIKDVMAQMPMNLHNADSADFIRNYADSWIDEQLLFQQGLKQLPDLDDLEREVAQYRRNLIAQMYMNERLKSFTKEVSEEECRTYYETYKDNMRLDRPIVQGIFIQLFSDTKKIKDLKGWLQQMGKGNMDHAEELEQYCQLRAVYYDSFMEQWIPVSLLSDHLPQPAIDMTQLPETKVCEMEDSTYTYLFLISDARLKDEVKPFEYVRKDIEELLVQRNRSLYRTELRKQLRQEAIKSGDLKIKF